ncbi:MAG: PfkB family carbohydrate kinase [Spirochaetota bacterium]
MRGLFLGFTTLDLIHYVHGTIGQNEKISADGTRIHTGGPAANAAITFSQLGGETELITFVGNSHLTSVIAKELSDYGVNLDNRSKADGEHPVAASVVVNTETGDRMVIDVKPSDPRPSDFTVPQFRPDIVLTDTYYLETVKPYLRWAKGERIPVVLDGGSWKQGLETILPYVNYAICSEKFFAPGCSSFAESAAALRGMGVSTICFTRGEKPILIYEEEGDPQELPVPAAQEVKDTLAAGDIFHGAFCHYIVATGGNLQESLTSAASIASGSVANYGPRTW